MRFFLATLITTFILACVITSCKRHEENAKQTSSPESSELPDRLQWKADGIPMAEPLKVPFEFVSVDGKLTAEIVAAYRETSLPAIYKKEDGSLSIRMQDYGIRNYGIEVDGELKLGFPGPTLRLRKGDHEVEATMKNQIVDPDPPHLREDGCNDEPSSPPDDVWPNCQHDNDVLNIHYHGSHVTPGSTGDNVFIKIYPEGTELTAEQAADPLTHVGQFTSNFKVGASQMPGTHWYHSHHHGSTALQNNDGMAAAFIIEGDFEGISEIEAADEVLMVLQQLTTTQLFFVNGAISPRIEMRPGEVKRFRFVSGTATIGSYIKSLFFETPEGEVITDPDMRPGIYQIAQDGVEFLDHQWQSVLASPEAYTSISLASANRADFLVQAPTHPGEYFLIVKGIEDPPVGPPGYDLPQVLGQPGAPGIINDPTFPAPPLLIIEVKGSPANMALPANLRTLEQLPPGQQRVVRPIEDSEIVRKKVVTYDMSIGGDNSPQFYIDSEKYDPDEVDHCMGLDTAEEWKIVNRSTPPHPFHIHVNPFFVTEYYDANNPTDSVLKPGNPRSRWQDTVALPPARLNADGTELEEASYIVVRSRYLDYTGEFVTHCHILGHEDRGMMQNVKIIAGTTEACLKMEESGTMDSKHTPHGQKGQ
jgi:FtsP/CotA-like multicopper oxidase with cupredoxin domain